MFVQVCLADLHFSSGLAARNVRKRSDLRRPVLAAKATVGVVVANVAEEGRVVGAEITDKGI